MEPVQERIINGGPQKVYRFPNGYGASVVSSPASYGGGEGLWELGVAKWEGPDDDDWQLTYETPITDDVIGYLDWHEVESLLLKIEAL